MQSEHESERRIHLLTGVDNTLLDTYVTVVWGYTTTTPASTLTASISSILPSLISTQFPLLVHPVGHSPSIGYFHDLETTLPPTVTLCDAPDWPTPHPPRPDGSDAWDPPPCAYALDHVAGGSDDEEVATGHSRPLRPAFCCKVTQVDAGLAVTGSLLHGVGDASSLVALMLAISNCLDQDDTGEEEEEEDIVHHHEDKISPFTGDPGAAPESPPPTFANPIPMDFINESFNHPPSPPIVPVRRRVTRAEIDALKVELGTEEYVPSSNDILCALALSDVARAVPAAVEMGLYFPVNLRGRYPGVDQDYFGNAVLPSATEPLPARTLASLSLGEIARSVAMAKEEGVACHPEKVDQVLAWEAARPEKHYALYSCPWLTLAITNWAWFPFFSLTLGIGSPVCITPAHPFWVSGLGYILPCEPGSDAAFDLIYTHIISEG